MPGARYQRIVRTTIAAAITLPFLLPLFFLISTAVRTEADYIDAPGGLPQSFTGDHIVEAWNEADLSSALFNTMIVCVIACVVCASVALSGGYWFRINQHRWTGILRFALAAGYAIPMVAWLIPVFVIAAQVGLTGNLVVAGIVNGAAALPFAFYFVHTFLRQSLTTEVIEAASLDGAGIVKSFWRIGIPMAAPALAATIALTFVWTFGDLLVSATLLQNTPDSYTITLAATTLTTREDVNLQGQAAAALVALLPTLVVFAIAQRALKLGFGAGSGK